MTSLVVFKLAEHFVQIRWNEGSQFINGFVDSGWWRGSESTGQQTTGLACSQPLPIEKLRKQFETSTSVLPLFSQHRKWPGRLTNLPKVTSRVWAESVSCSVMSDFLWLHGLQPGSSVHGILQERILEWVAIPFSRGSSQPSDRT